jgi:hypothetical protein
VTAPVRPKLDCALGSGESTLSMSMFCWNSAYRKWLPGAPLGSVAVTGHCGAGRMSLPATTFLMRSSSLRIEITVCVGVPVSGSTLRTVCGRIWPKPLATCSISIAAPEPPVELPLPPRRREEESRGTHQA